MFVKPSKFNVFKSSSKKNLLDFESKLKPRFFKAASNSKTVNLLFLFLSKRLYIHLNSFKIYKLESDSKKIQRFNLPVICFSVYLSSLFDIFAITIFQIKYFYFL